MIVNEANQVVLFSLAVMFLIDRLYLEAKIYDFDKSYRVGKR